MFTAQEKLFLQEGLVALVRARTRLSAKVKSPLLEDALAKECDALQVLLAKVKGLKP